MRVFIMTDLEGVAGVIDWQWAQSNYELARNLLTMEVNAAIEGFFAGGAAGILVADAHGPGAINPEKLHPKAELSRNWPRGKAGFSMDEQKFDFAAWVGQHPMAGTVGGHMTHTGDTGVRQKDINGIVVGEFGELVLVASSLGVRSIFAAGCEAFCREARDFVPGIETVSVKKGTQTEPGHHLPQSAYKMLNTGAIHLHPEESRRRIKEGAKRAISRAVKEDFGLVEVPPPPYTRTTIIRGGSDHPPLIIKQTHPDSLIGMLSAKSAAYELNIDPAAPDLRELIGKEIRTDRE